MRQWRTAAFWFTYILVGIALYWLHPLNPDEGLTLTGAWRVVLGDMPYRDFFDFTPPGSWLLLAGAFQLFGTTYLVARVTVLVGLLAAGVLLHHLCRKHLTGWRLGVVPFVWLGLMAHYPLVNHNVLALAMSVGAWAAVTTALRRPTPGWFVLAGLLTAGVGWLLQAKAAAVLAAALVLFTTSSHRWRAVSAYLGGVLVGLLPLLAIAPLPVLWEHLVTFPLQHYLPVNQTAYLTWLVLAILYAALTPGWRRGSDRWEVGWWWLGMWLLVSTLSRTDVFHLIINAYPLIPLTLARLQSARGQPILARAAVGVASVGLVTLGAVSLVTAGVHAASIGWENWIALRNPKLEHVRQLVDAVAPPGSPIYAGPFLPNVYFELQRPNPTRFNILLTGHHPPAFFAQAATQLQQHPPVLALVNYASVQQFHHSLDNPVDQLLRYSYRPIGSLGQLQLLQRIDAAN